MLRDTQEGWGAALEPPGNHSGSNTVSRVSPPWLLLMLRFPFNITYFRVLAGQPPVFAICESLSYLLLV